MNNKTKQFYKSHNFRNNHSSILYSCLSENYPMYILFPHPSLPPQKKRNFRQKSLKLKNKKKKQKLITS